MSHAANHLPQQIAFEEVILHGGEEEGCEEEGHQEEGCEEEEVVLKILDLARPRGLIDNLCWSVPVLCPAVRS